MKTLIKLLSYLLALAIVAAAAGCLYVLVKIMPLDKNELYQERNTGSTEMLSVSEEAESLSLISGDELLGKVPLWTDIGNAVPIKKYDFISDAVWNFLNAVQTDAYKPFMSENEKNYDTLLLDGHIYADEEKHRIYIYKGEYKAKENKSQRLDMIFSYDSEDSRNLSLLYFHSVPMDTSDILDGVMADDEPIHNAMFHMMTEIRSERALYWPDISAEKGNYNEEDYNALWKEYRYVLYEKSKIFGDDEAAMTLNLRLIYFMSGLYSVKNELKYNEGSDTLDYYEILKEALTKDDYNIFLYNRAGCSEIELMFYNTEKADAENASIVLSFNCNYGCFNGLCVKSPEKMLNR